MGQRGGTWLPWPDAPDHPRWSSWLVRTLAGQTIRCRDVAGQAQWERQEDWGDESVPAIAAWICSAGRVRLLRAIRCAGWQEVYYCDTDGLLVSAAGFGRLQAAGWVRDGALGYLRLLWCGGDCHVYGAKHYALAGQRTCAGLPRGRAVEGPIPGTYWYTDALARTARAGQQPIVERTLRGYSFGPPRVDGEIGPDGWVRPLEVDDP
jgi:hypothetical protein